VWVQATIAYAESMDLTLDLRFTDPAAPLFIDVENDGIECLFVVSTSKVHGSVSASQNASARMRAHDSATPTPDRRRPQKVVERRDVSVSVASRDYSVNSMPPPSVPACKRDQEPQTSVQRANGEPLFFPSASQLSAADEAALRDSGLDGVEGMNLDDFNAMFDDPGVEVGFSGADDAVVCPPPQPRPNANGQRDASLDLVDELGPTQGSSQDVNEVSPALICHRMTVKADRRSRHSGRCSTIERRLVGNVANLSFCYTCPCAPIQRVSTKSA
jgi:hypothetical protein